MQTTQEIIIALQAQREGTTTKLAEHDKMVTEYVAAKKAERATLLAGVAPIDRALAALGVKVAGVTTNGTGVRRPMSQEAKDRIRAGLLAASARKRAGVAPPAVQRELHAPVAVASAPAPKPVPAKTASKKAGGRG